MLYRFKWDQLVSQELIDALSDLSEENNVSKVSISSYLTLLFTHAGGLPYAYSNWEGEHRLKVAKKLIHEATTRFLRFKYTLSSDRTGYMNVDGELVAHPRLDINLASRKELIDLPVLGDSLAAQILNERSVNGAFSSSHDLKDRIKGLGEDGIFRLSGILNFDSETVFSRHKIHNEFDKDFKLAIYLSSSTDNKISIESFLNELVVFVATNPHPASKNSWKRDDLEPEAFLPLKFQNNAERVEILVNQLYYDKVSELVDQAIQGIDICMFFISLGGEEHPTRKLLKKIIEKSNDGLTVRVLVDRDRPDDPYGSSIINSKAAKLLSDNGVSVRMDQTEKLLHSKFVLIDNKITIVGSHNWTSGSFFIYDDLSLLLHGNDVNSLWKERFQNLWENSENYG